jgi:hypothetical protein
MLKAQIKKVLKEFDIKLEDPHNLSDLLQMLEQKGYVTISEIKAIETSILKYSPPLAGKEEPYVVFNQSFEIVFYSEKFPPFSLSEQQKITDVLKLVKETHEPVELELDAKKAKVASLFRENYFILYFI